MRSSSRPLLNSVLARALLALALLFGQQTAALHWLSHSIEATQSAKSGGASGSTTSGKTLNDPCDECLALSALGAAAASGEVPTPDVQTVHALVALAAPASAPSLLTLGFRSRAPPIPI